MNRTQRRANRRVSGYSTASATDFQDVIAAMRCSWPTKAERKRRMGKR